jgi:predicted tellurium resistance membrane protein TerC
MSELLIDPQSWIALATLIVLEIVLGIDNIVFLSITTARLPSHQRVRAQRIGLTLALVLRVVFLLGITWIIGLTAPFVSIGGYSMSWRDLVLMLGGLFLLTKSTREIHAEVEGQAEGAGNGASSFMMAIVQIGLLDLVFSIDSVITAVGMVDEVVIMIIAVIVAIIVMMVAAERVSDFVQRHPTVKMLALSFLFLVAMALIADAMHFHIPRGYLYFAIAFSLMVELFNLRAAKRRARDR